MSGTLELLSLSLSALARVYGLGAGPIDAAVLALLTDDERRSMQRPPSSYPYAMPIGEARAVILAFVRRRVAQQPGEIARRYSAADSIELALDGLGAVESVAVPESLVA